MHSFERLCLFWITHRNPTYDLLSPTAAWALKLLQKNTPGGGWGSIHNGERKSQLLVEFTTCFLRSKVFTVSCHLTWSVVKSWEQVKRGCWGENKWNFPLLVWRSQSALLQEWTQLSLQVKKLTPYRLSLFSPCRLFFFFDKGICLKKKKKKQCPLAAFKGWRKSACNLEAFQVDGDRIPYHSSPQLLPKSKF